MFSEINVINNFKFTWVNCKVQIENNNWKCRTYYERKGNFIGKYIGIIDKQHGNR